MRHTYISVYRDAKDNFQIFNSNTLSYRVNSGELFWDCTREEAIEYCEDKMINPNDQFFLHKRELWGEDYSYAEPLILQKGNQMFGGNFLFTCNDNCYHFGKERTCRPIPIHDRFEEWQEDYD